MILMQGYYTGLIIRNPSIQCWIKLFLPTVLDVSDE